MSEQRRQQKAQRHRVRRAARQARKAAERAQVARDLDSLDLSAILRNVAGMDETPATPEVRGLKSTDIGG